MTPYKYTKTPIGYKYHYHFSHLRDFLTKGYKDGNVGMIITQVEDGFIKYRGFGTIENPWKYIVNLTMRHCDLFSGGPFDPEAYINPKPFFTKENTRFTIFNFKNNN